MIMLKSIAARSSWRSPVIKVKQASETQKQTEERSVEETLDYVSCFSLHFFRALAASCVLYNRTEHSQGFSIC